MTVDEIIDFFKEASPVIFEHRSCFKKIMNGLCCCLPVPCFPYSQDGMGEKIDEKFGGATLKDLRQVECIAGAVAKEYDTEKGDYVLEIFDTRSHITYDIKEVLKASSCAPIFFETPTFVGRTQFVDGGFGGNCPLIQAIPRMEKITRNRRKINSALSIAPPRADSKYFKTFL